MKKIEQEKKRLIPIKTSVRMITEVYFGTVNPFKILTDLLREGPPERLPVLMEVGRR